MQYFVLSPEVGGGLARDTVLLRDRHPPVVSHLHCELDGWLGDDLLETYPCFLVTTSLADKLRRETLSGYQLRAAQVSTSDLFRELYPDREVPRFLWLEATGRVGVDDFAVTEDGRLVVSESALTVLKKSQLRNCDVSEFQ